MDAPRNEESPLQAQGCQPSRTSHMLSWANPTGLHRYLFDTPQAGVNQQHSTCLAAALPSMQYICLARHLPAALFRMRQPGPVSSGHC